MKRWILAASVACAPVSADDTRDSTKRYSGLDRTLSQEPTYQTSPKYCLMLLGKSGDVKVWMVEDGKRLFVDKNANGDLTDDGPPIEPVSIRKVGNGWDFDYLLDAITSGDDARHTAFHLRRWNYGEKEDSYGLSLTVNGQLPVYAGWFGTFWSADRETAPVIHFGGAFTPHLLRSKQFVIGSKSDRLSLGLMNRGSGPGAESRLSIEALPATAVPQLNIEWPTAGGAPPLRTSHRLTARCCYWEFYTPSFKVPSGAIAGTAKVTVDLPIAGTPILLSTTQFEVPVVAQTNEVDSGR